jgi:hypothetical protein
MCHRVSLGPSSLVSLVSGKSVPVLTLVVLIFEITFAAAQRQAALSTLNFVTCCILQPQFSVKLHLFIGSCLIHHFRINKSNGQH